ncbi:hypothetical protein GCM10025865_14580 [Paraoerskovia sediminicola]|uniref:Uncharacterized protein n=1 Tax=Paraoerskovia sediminicola TaxID=1138587 RepID=A0ABM8G284_9CELL|nr:hypothetical protein [Paraoerskovia sediminicola]BDZ42159.1 hypothetical protein GCM10025865_14580 [Paraoerskovia sediminicola]
MTKYEARVTHEDGWWMIRVDGVGVTQARRLSEARTMVREFIAVSTDDLEPEDVDVTVEVMVEAVDILQAVASIRAEREEAARLEADAAARAKALARQLSDAGLSLRDVGAALGVSHQRAHQLVSA